MSVEVNWIQGKCGCRLACAQHRRLLAAEADIRDIIENLAHGWMLAEEPDFIDAGPALQKILKRYRQDARLLVAKIGSMEEPR